MTPGQVRPWLLPIGLVLAVGALVWVFNDRRGLARTLEREREASALDAAGVARAHEATRGQLADQVAANEALRLEVERIKAASPGARPIGTASGTTGAMVVGPAAAGALAFSPPATSGAVPSSPVPALCRVLEGDGLEVRFAGAVLETRAGNLAVAAVGSAWRVPAGGGAPSLLVEGPLRLDVSALPRPGGPGWGGGLLVLGLPGGWAAGPLVSPPPLSVFGFDLSLLAGAAVGPAGSWAGMVGALVRGGG
jgi:hypothetical protein